MAAAGTRIRSTSYMRTIVLLLFYWVMNVPFYYYTYCYEHDSIRTDRVVCMATCRSSLHLDAKFESRKIL